MDKKSTRPRPNSCVRCEPNACTSKCAFRQKAPMREDQLVISLASPVLGRSAQELLRRHMDRIGEFAREQEGRRTASTAKRRIESRASSSLASPIRSISLTGSRISNGGDREIGAEMKNSGSSEGMNTSPLKTTFEAPKNFSTPITTPVRKGSSLGVTRSSPLLLTGSASNARKSETPKCMSSSNVASPQMQRRTETDEIQLNFNYKRHYAVPNNSIVHIGEQPTLEPNRPTPSSSSTSSYETAEIIYKFRRRIKSSRKEPNFTKYIPVSLPASLHVPRLFLNQIDPGEWMIAQEAYERDRVENLNHSGSDTRINEELDRLIPGTPNKSVKCMSMRCISSENSARPSSSKTVDPIFHNYVKSPHAPKRMDKRFDQDKAENLIAANTKQNPDYMCVLYAVLPENPNYALCHAMTELCVAAMLNYFHPYREVQCLWIADMQAKLVELLKDHRSKPRFTRLVYLRKFDAILVLSEDASHLLKHKDMCFLHSIASALKIQPHKLLVLCMECSDKNRPGTA